MDLINNIAASFQNSQNSSLTPNKRQAIIWTNDGLVYWRIYS